MADQQHPHHEHSNVLPNQQPSSSTQSPPSTSTQPPPSTSTTHQVNEIIEEEVVRSNQQPTHQTWMHRAKPFFIVILLQFLFALMNLFSKMAMNNGLSSYIIVPYRNASAFVVIAPFAIYYERNRWPKMTFTVCVKMWVLSILGPIMDQDFYFLGMQFSTATLAFALGNTLPAMTFVLACATG
ncbi:hypothetical protein P8452_02398 [Trifolium repens]|nr:hypothetical protein P8452_02398 [Trifolium repens]